MEQMKKRLVEAIRDCNELCRDCDRLVCDRCFLNKEYEKEADALLERGILVPPVKIGDTVFAVVELDDGPEVCEYVVEGIGYSYGKWLVCANDNEFNEVGTRWCLMTREEAENLALEMRKEGGYGDQ